MKLKTSFFNWTLFRRNLLRTMPLWIIYTLLFLVILPLSRVGELIFGNAGDHFIHDYLNTAVLSGDLIHLAYGTILGAVMFSYLHKTRSAYMLHAFPVIRSGLFVTNWVSGLAVMAIPQLLVACVSLLVCSGAHSAKGAAAVGLGYLVLVLQFLFFYGLTVFCMHLTGKTAAGVLTALVLNFLAVILEGLTRSTVRPLLYGISAGDLKLNFLSPFVEMLRENWSASGTFELSYFLILGAVGLALAVLAWLLYRKRHMERAGDLMVFGWARPIFKYGFTYLITMVLGWFLCVILLGGTVHRTQTLALGGLLGLACVIGCFVAEMLLKRTVKVFRWKQFLSVLCCLAVLWGGLAALYVDAFHVIRHVPGPEQVASVELDFGQWDDPELHLEDPAAIRAVTAYHSAVVDPEFWDDSIFSGDVTITYHLQNGGTLRRSYPDNSAFLEAKTALFGTRSIVEEYYESANWNVQVVLAERGDDSFALTREQTDRLHELIRQDMENGLLQVANTGRKASWRLNFGSAYAQNSRYLHFREGMESWTYLDQLLNERP